MIILGIDPGIARVGYGIIAYDGVRLRPRAYGCIETPAGMPIDQRLLQIDIQMEQLIETYEPQEMAFEELFFYQNKTTGIMVAQARGVEVLSGVRKGLGLYEYTPSMIKQSITGYGRATKRQMQESIRMLLHLKEIPKPDDAADGLAVAVCHAFAQRFKEQHRMK